MDVWYIRRSAEGWCLATELAYNPLLETASAPLMTWGHSLRLIIHNFCHIHWMCCKPVTLFLLHDIYWFCPSGKRDPPLLLSWRFLPFFPLWKSFFSFLGSYSWSDVRSKVRDVVCVQIVKPSEANSGLYTPAIPTKNNLIEFFYQCFWKAEHFWWCFSVNMVTWTGIKLLMYRDDVILIKRKHTEKELAELVTPAVTGVFY